MGKYNVKNDDDDDDEDDDDDDEHGWRLLDDKTLGICTTIAMDVCMLSSESMYSMSVENTNANFNNDDECEK